MTTTMNVTDWTQKLINDIRKDQGSNIGDQSVIEQLNNAGISDTLSKVYDRNSTQTRDIFLGQDFVNDTTKSPVLVYGEVWLQAENVEKVLNRSVNNPGRIVETYVIPTADGENEGIPQDDGEDPLSNIIIDGIAIIDKELGIANIGDVIFKEWLGNGTGSTNGTQSRTGSIELTASGTPGGDITIYVQDDKGIKRYFIGIFSWQGSYSATVDAIVNNINGRPSDPNAVDYLPFQATKEDSSHFRLEFTSTDGCKKNDWKVIYTADTLKLETEAARTFSQGVCPKWSGEDAKGEVGENDPVTGEPIASLDAPKSTFKFEELSNVEATSQCTGAVPYYDATTCTWKTKHINDLILDINPDLEN